ncbi:MAG: glycosyltransferase family 2 protein [Candidatus Aenigmarchaeota archaeon]|nr:glycosyltransferase family 2 protein [Candidatus Aenigmarchaeota archaeon]MDW8149085.1 glycosyltransferase family 2 protein [Candidatus Aenigmarchaeota archaeon]
MFREGLVAIIILNLNGKEITDKCINSIIKLTSYKNYKIIVVDNGSKDGSVQYIRKKYGKKVDIVELEKNYGYSIGINEGIKFAIKKYDPDFLLFLNNDMEVVEKRWIEKMLKIFEYNNKIMSVGCNLIFPDGRLQYDGIRNFSRIFLPFEVASKAYPKYKKDWGLVYVGTGAPLVIKKDCIEKIGYFDAAYTPFSSEEIDYLTRIKKSGYLNAYCYSTKIIHYLSLTCKKFPNVYRFWLIKRNIFYYHLKHFKKFIILVILGQLFATIIDKKNDLEQFTKKNIKIKDF